MTKQPWLLHLAQTHETGFRILLTVVTGLLAWVWIHAIATMALPFGYSHPVSPEELPGTFWQNQQSLRNMAWPMAIMIALSANFLASAFLRPRRHLSKWGHITLAWPLIDFFPVSVLGILYIPILVGPILAIVVSGITVVKRRYWGNLLSLAWIGIWLSVALTYGNRMWEITGD